MDEVYLRALRKKALGYTVRERVSEYEIEEGRAVEVKRRVHAKHVPGDLAALKYLLETVRADYSKYTDEELERERKRLLEDLVATQKEDSDESD